MNGEREKGKGLSLLLLIFNGPFFLFFLDNASFWFRVHGIAVWIFLRVSGLDMDTDTDMDIVGWGRMKVENGRQGEERDFTHVRFLRSL